MKKENILGFDVLNIHSKDLLENIFLDINNNDQNIIVNINPFIIMNFIHNDSMKAFFNKQQYQIPDGDGIVWASKHRGSSIKKRITGIDLMEKICKRSVEEKKSIFLCGSSPDNVKKCKEKLEKKYQGINIAGYCNGYISEIEMTRIINKSNPDILFVALGSPKQELFIYNFIKKIKNVKLIMPVGGSFDVIGGTIKRAPIVIQRLHLEWLYRMVTEPKRIKRNISLFRFVFLVLFSNK